MKCNETVFLHVFPGGYRALGLGGRTGGYGTPGGYGTALKSLFYMNSSPSAAFKHLLHHAGGGMGAGLGAGGGLPNGLTLGLGQGGKRGETHDKRNSSGSQVLK